MAGCTENKTVRTLPMRGGKDVRGARSALLTAMALIMPCNAATVHGQTLPPMAPTTPIVASGASSGSTHTASGPVVRPAQVAYIAGRLQVSADNSSLNQILREIGRLTGMKITGGVVEERVFGSYGPADPTVVLSALLNGTGSNMMLRLDAAHRPAELVLTPRLGGVTPPNPNASRYSGRDDDLPPERRSAAPQQSFPYAGVPGATPTQAVPQPSTEVPTGAGAGTNTTTQESPNGVKTPQEIYDQLMKMQQPAKPPQ